MPTGGGDATNVKTWIPLIKHGGFHPKSNIQTLHELQKAGGHGSPSVSSTAWNSEHSQGLLHESLRQLKTDGDEEQEEEVYWMTKPLHGIYLHHLSTSTSVPSTDRGSGWLKKSYQRLEKASAKDSTEARITSAKEQAPRSRPMEGGATTANRTQVTDCAKVPRRRSRT